MQVIKLIHAIGHLPKAGEEVRVDYKGYSFVTSEQKDKVLRQIHITGSPDPDQEI